MTHQIATAAASSAASTSEKAFFAATPAKIPTAPRPVLIEVPKTTYLTPFFDFERDETSSRPCSLPEAEDRVYHRASVRRHKQAITHQLLELASRFSGSEGAASRWLRLMANGQLMMLSVDDLLAPLWGDVKFSSLEQIALSAGLARIADAVKIEPEKQRLLALAETLSQSL